MADDKLYAWSDIVGPEKPINAGDAVTAASVGGKGELDVLVAAGAVRAEQYPNCNMGESPNEAKLRMIRAQLDAMGATVEDVT